MLSTHFALAKLKPSSSLVPKVNSLIIIMERQFLLIPHQFPSHSSIAIHNLSRFKKWRQLSRPWAFRRHRVGVALACITAHKHNREKR